MKRSRSYTIVALVLKLKGIKKTFSADPIDYKKLRKGDVKKPKGNFYKKKATSFKVLESVITEIPSENTSKKLLLYIPGGAFISGPVKYHWNAIKEFHRNTDYTIWMCDYPKAPEYKITQISNNIDAIYADALTKHADKDIVIMGDSVGGTLSMALIQRLIKKGKQLPLKLLLITPVVDASMSNPELSELDKKDIMLSLKGMLSAHKMCAENAALKTPNISPVYGSFKGFPETILYLGTEDITSHDTFIVLKMMKREEVNYKAVIGERMPHVWPLLPFLKEGKSTLKRIIRALNA